ncbi:microtubule-associated protein futsch [Trichonephila clavipes]|nr:microtubule-associated protein futsch [Trichonephila clavipes]
MINKHLLQRVYLHQNPDVEDTQITEEIDESDGTSTITKTVTTVTRKILVPSEGAEEVETIPKDDQKPSSQKSESSSKTSEVDYQKSLSPKSVSPSHTPDGDDIHVTEETEEGDGTSTITKTVTTIVRKVVVPSEDTESETTFEKDDKQASTPKSISPSKSPDVEDTQITEEIDESDGTSTITKTVTTVTRKIVVPSEGAEEVETIPKDDQKPSSEKSESSSKTSEVDYQKSLSPKSVSPSHTPDGDDIHVTEETEEGDGTATITKTVTTIVRKVVVPSEDTESETTFEKDDKQASTPKSISPSKSPDVEDTQITEEIDVSDGTSTITKTVTTVTRKIVVPSESAEEVETITKDDQKPSSQKSESSSKTSEVDYQKSLSPKSVSPSHTPDGDDIHVTEETEEGDATSTITKTVTTIVRKVVVPSEDTESETTFEKDDKQASTPKSISPSKSPDVEDTQITEEIDESDGTSTITKTVTTVTRKLVVPSEGAEEVETITKDDQKPSSQKSESSSKTSEVDYQKSLSPKSVSPSHTPDGDDIHVTEETEEGDATSTITKTVTTIVRKVAVTSEDTESETTFEKDDKQASTPKSISPSKSPDVEDTQITEEIDESDGTSTITKTVTTVTRKILVPSEGAEEVETIPKDDQKPSSQKSESSSKTSEVDYQKSLSPKSVSPSHTPDGDDIHVTEENEEGDGTSTITKTVTTIVRKVVVPSEDTESETTFEKDDKQASTPKSISPSKSPDVEDTQITEEIDESDGTSTITKTVTTVTRKILVPSEGAEEVETIPKDDQKLSSQKSESSSKTSEVDYQKSLSPKSVSPSHTPDGDDIHVTEETEEGDGTSTITKTVTTIVRKVVVPSEDTESETTFEKDDKQASTPKSISPSKSPDVEDTQVTEKIDESDETSTITKTVTTVTRKIVVPSDGAEEVETSTKDDQKPSSQKSESSSKSSEVDYQKSLSPKSASPSQTPDGDDIHVTEETEEGDGTSTITKTVTTIVRKVVVPSEDTESETTFEKDDKQASTPKSISPSKSPDVEDTQITEEIDESDGTSTITKTVTTVTRKIVVPSEGAEEVETSTKDDQKPSSQKSESSSKTSEVDYQKSLSPKSASPSQTPDGDDIHVTEETEEGDGTSTITKTVTTIVRKVVVPSEDTESETTFEKDDKQASTPKSISPSKSPDVEDTQITEEIDESDGTSTITKTVTTVTRKIVVPSEGAEEVETSTTDDQKPSSQKSESSSKTSEVDYQKSLSPKSASPSHTPDGDDIHVTEETEEGDGTSTITKTVTTIVRKVVVPSEDTERETFEKDDKQASTPKSISPSKSPDVEDTQITEEIDESDGTSTITKTVTTVTRKLVVPSEGAEEVETITKDDQKPSSQKSESSSKTSEVDYQKSLSPKSVSPSQTPDGDDIHVTEETEEGDGTSTITKTVTTIIRKVVVPSEGIESESTFEKQASTLKSKSPSKSPDVEDTQITEEIDKSDGTSTITKTVTTVTRKIVVPSEDAEEVETITKDEQKPSSQKSESSSKTSEVDYQKSLSPKSASPSQTPDGDDIHETEETEESDGTSTITKTVTTITRKIIVPSEDVEYEIAFDKDDKQASTAKSISPLKSPDAESVQIREEMDEGDGISTITKTVTRKIVVPSDDAEEVVSIRKDDQKLSSQMSDSLSKTPDGDDIHKTEEIDGASKTSETATAITRKIVAPSEDAGDFAAVITDDQTCIPKVETISKISDDGEVHVLEESDETDGASTIKRTITTVTRKIVIPSDDVEDVTELMKDRQKAVTTGSSKKEETGVLTTSEISTDITSTTKTSVQEDSIYEKSTKSEKSSVFKVTEDTESKSESMTITKSDSSQQKIDIHSKESQIKSEAEKIDKKSEKILEDSVTESSITKTTLVKEYESLSDSKISESIKTTSKEIITGKRLTELSMADDENTKDLSRTIITSISEETAYEDSRLEKSSIDSTVKIMETSEIMTKSFDDTSGTSSPRTRLSSEDDTTEDSPRKKKSKRKEPRTVRKKIIVYQTGADDSAESMLTEDQIREAIIEAGGKRSSKSHIISYGTVDDLESLSGKENVVELRSRTTTPQPEEECTTQKTETTTREELESIEVDPFSLITKPIEETFRKKMLEQQSSVKTTEIKQVTSKETSKETIEEIVIDTKVATDAKKLAVETLRSSRERTETTQSDVSETEEVTSSTSTTERTSTTESRMSGPSQSDRDEDTKSFNLDEWGKPMGLPSPPEPLDFDTDLSIIHPI